MSGHDCDDCREDYSPSGQPSGKWLRFANYEPELKKLLVTGWIMRKPPHDIIDLGSGQKQLCDMCEREEPRYIHCLERGDPETRALIRKHFDGQDELQVGCICAGHLTGWFALQFELRREKDASERNRLIRQQRRKDCACAAKRAQNTKTKRDDDKANENEANGMINRTSHSTSGKGDIHRLHEQNKRDGNPDDPELVIPDGVIERSEASDFLEDVRGNPQKYGRGKRGRAGTEENDGLQVLRAKNNKSRLTRKNGKPLELASRRPIDEIDLEIADVSSDSN
jgi:hypothetical protein